MSGRLLANGIVVSKLNSTAVAIGAGVTFTGEAELVNQFEELDINLAGAPSSAPAAFYFEFSPDGTNWDVSVKVGGTDISGPASVPPQCLRVILPYFRVRYVNGATPLSQFRLTTVLHRTGSLRLTRYLDQKIYDTEGVENTRSVIAFNHEGAYKNVSSLAPLPVIPRPYSSTAFGEFRVADPYTLADFTSKYGRDAGDFGVSLVGGGTVSDVSTQSAIRVAVAGTNGDSAKLRTNTYFRYQAGKSLLTKQSIYNSDSGQSNQIRRWGFFDDNDGIFWRLSGTALSVVRRSSTSGSVVDTVFAQSSWSVDKMDGTGPSGITLDVTKGNIYEIQMQWLGVGTVNLYIDGYLTHSMVHSNTLAVPYMRSANLPLSVEVQNTGASSAGSLTFICASVVSEGGQPPPVLTYAAYNTSNRSVSNSPEIPLLSIRPKDQFGGIDNRMIVVPQRIFGSTDGGRAALRLVMNGTLTAPSWVSANANSGVEYDISATGISGGDTVARVFLPNTTDSIELDVKELFGVFNSKQLKKAAFGAALDTLSIVGVKDTGGSTDMRASIYWHEIR